MPHKSFKCNPNNITYHKQKKRNEIKCKNKTSPIVANCCFMLPKCTYSTCIIAVAHNRLLTTSSASCTMILWLTKKAANSLPLFLFCCCCCCRLYYHCHCGQLSSCHSIKDFCRLSHHLPVFPWRSYTAALAVAVTVAVAGAYAFCFRAIFIITTFVYCF